MIVIQECIYCTKITINSYYLKIRKLLDGSKTFSYFLGDEDGRYSGPSYGYIGFKDRNYDFCSINKKLPIETVELSNENFIFIKFKDESARNELSKKLISLVLEINNSYSKDK